VRLDNRDALAAAAGLHEPLSQTSDAELLLNSWTRDGVGCLERLIGDFAVAVFDKKERTLTLARDAAGQRPLFYARSDDAVAFASMPSGLLADREFNRGWNLRRSGSLLGSTGLNDPDTYFAGISRVVPGEVVTFSEVGRTRRFFWNPTSAKPHAMTFEEAVEQYRLVLNSAVESRLRRHSGLAAVHLSSGYDSSSIAAIAAAAPAPNEVLAYTAKPSADFFGRVPAGRAGDESGVASITAARLGLGHKLVNSTDFTLDFLRRQARLYQEPLRNIINALWTDEIRRRAAGDGVTVLLNGMAGNMTLNAGGSNYLTDWLQQRGIVPWWSQAKSVARRGDVRWRSILFSGMAPFLPAHVVRSASQLRPNRASAAAFVRKEWAVPARLLRDQEYERASRATGVDRVEFVRTSDPGAIHKGGLADSGVWELEPLADRTAVEFSLSLSPEQLICNGEDRPVARSALRDLLPREVLDAPRGIQSADWEVHFTRQAAAEILEEIRPCETASAFLDLAAIRSAIDAWPEPGDTGWHASNVYTSRLPMALNMGVFMKETEESWRRSA